MTGYSLPLENGVTIVLYEKHLGTTRAKLMFRIKCLSIAIMIAVPQVAVAFEGMLKCKVGAQQILEIKDGASETYSSYKGDLIVGDHVILRYGFSETYEFYLKSEGVEPLTPFYTSLKFDTKKAILIEENATAISAMTDDGFLSKQITLSADGFHIGYVFGEGGFHFERYYKSDWMGVYTYISDFVSHSYTLDCRHMSTSVWSGVFSKLTYALKKRT